MSGYAGQAGTGAGELAVFGEYRASCRRAEAWAAGPEAAKLDHAELETAITDRGRDRDRLLYQALLDLRAERERRQQRVEAPDGSVRTRAEKDRTRLLATVCGLVTVTRIGYRAPRVPVIYLADAELNLPAGSRFSFGLQEMAAAEAARGSYEDAADAVYRATGARIGKRQLEELARLAARDFSSFYAGRKRGACALCDGDVLVLQCDGKGIRVLPRSLRKRAARLAAKAVAKQQGRLSRGEAGCRKRVAETGAVYTITPVPRTVSDILGLPPGQDPDTPQATASTDTPRARDKWVTASVARDAAAVIADVFAEADRRDPAHQHTWVALVDGNKDQIARIKAEAAARRITITIIVDIIHVAEYLWDAAWCFYPEASPAAGPWVREQLRAILQGRAAGTAAAIRTRAAATDLPENKAKTAERTASYLGSKAPHLDYPAALDAGWPIATGVIEGTCRYLIKDRMDITGARWSTEGAEAILQIRAIRANGDWDQYQAWHRLQEHHRNHRGHQNCWQLAA
jgi:hypothetical protein